MPTSRPSTHFVDGVCSACLNFDKRQEINWREREEVFLRILEGLPENDSGYQVIVASSGGKDSHAQVIKMLDLGIRPLIVTASTCHLTEIGRKNIDNLKRFATTIEFSPNLSVRAKLNRIGLRLVGDISLPEHMAIFSTPFQAAVAFGISTIIYGESPQFEYGGPPDSEQATVMTRRWVYEHGGFLGMRPYDFVGIDGITAKDVKEYILPSKEKLEGITAYFLGQYYPWDSHKNAEIATHHGMMPRFPCLANIWVHENLDNAQTGLHDYFGWLKYGYGRGCAQASIDIRQGRRSRDDAWKEVKSRDGLFPCEYMGVSHLEVLERIGVAETEFRTLCDKFTNHELHKARISAEGE